MRVISICLIGFHRCERILHPGDYPSQFYDEEDDERDVNSAVKTALTALGKVHSFTQDVFFDCCSSATCIHINMYKLTFDTN